MFILYIEIDVLLCYNIYRGDTVLKYKIDVLAALKSRGFNTNKLRKEKLLSEGAIQALRENRSIAWVSIEKICELLEVQPGDLLEIVPDEDDE